MSRLYGQFCGLAHALDLVGSRWTMLIVRELLSGPKRFADLQQGLAGIATNILSGRLRDLEEANVVTRRLLPRPASATVYALTPYGEELKAPLVALGVWGARSMAPPGAGDVISLSGMALALSAAFHPDVAGDLKQVYELRLGSRSLFVSVADQRASVVSRPSSEQESDLVLTATPETVGGILTGAIGVDQALHSGLLTSRNGAEARRFFAMFAGLTEGVSRP